MKLNELTIAAAGEGIRKKDFSVFELVSACREAIAAQDGLIHAYLDVFDEALEEARSRDDEIARYDAAEMRCLPLLFGIPLAIKDNILIKGKRCTAGSRMLERYVASYDATVVSRLKAQGAVVLGKTNMDEFAMGSSTEYSAFGPTHNPRDPSRVPGGSSGGSAGAVAADMCLAALGSDTGGSIRQPAAFCGIVGMKPTYGAVSRHGLIAMASSLDQIGPMTKSVPDAQILLCAIAGGDARDATATQELESSRRESGLQGVRVGVPKIYFGAGLDEEIKKTVESAVGRMERAGAEITEIDLPHAAFALPAYYISVPSEVSANLARFDGIRYGHHAKDARTLFDVYARTRGEGFGSEVKRRIMLGTYALSAGYYDAYYLKAQKVRTLIRRDFEEAFGRVDVIAGPTTPTPAFRIGERSHDPLAMYLADIYTVAANLAGLPALSLPAGLVGRDGSNLPVGLHLVGPRGGDAALLNTGAAVESLLAAR